MQEFDFVLAYAWEHIKKAFLHISPTARFYHHLRLIFLNQKREFLAVKLVIISANAVIKLRPVIIRVAKKLRLAKVASRVDKHNFFVKAVK